MQSPATQANPALEQEKVATVVETTQTTEIASTTGEIKVSRFKRVIRIFLRRHPIFDHKDYLDASIFKNKFTPKEGTDYIWVMDYARKLYEKLESTYVEVDNKADSIIKYLGGGTGLLTISALVGTQKPYMSVICWAIPAALFALLSVVFSIFARAPADCHLPPTIEGAVIYAEKVPNPESDFVIGQYHWTCATMALAIKRKSRFVKWSMICFGLAVILLILPMLEAGAIAERTSLAVWFQALREWIIGLFR